MGETLTREQIDDIERCHDVIREGSELLATARRELAETEARLSAAVLGREHYRVEAEQSRRELGEVRAENKATRARIAQAVGAVHEWDYGSSPGTWEQIEDKAKSDYQQAAYDLDARIVAEYGLAIMSRRARRWEAAARRLHESRESTRQWYAVRWVRLKELLRGTTYWQEAMCTVANGTANVHEPPTYAQQLNMMRFAEERAIAQRDVARADLAAARRELGEVRADAERLRGLIRDLIEGRTAGDKRKAYNTLAAALGKERWNG